LCGDLDYGKASVDRDFNSLFQCSSRLRLCGQQANCLEFKAGEINTHIYIHIYASNIRQCMQNEINTFIQVKHWHPTRRHEAVFRLCKNTCNCVVSLRTRNSIKIEPTDIKCWVYAPSTSTQKSFIVRYTKLSVLHVREVSRLNRSANIQPKEEKTEPYF
jgi:hypothetical protein